MFDEIIWYKTNPHDTQSLTVLAKSKFKKNQTRNVIGIWLLLRAFRKQRIERSIVQITAISFTPIHNFVHYHQGQAGQQTGNKVKLIWWCCCHLISWPAISQASHIYFRVALLVFCSLFIPLRILQACSSFLHFYIFRECSRCCSCCKRNIYDTRMEWKPLKKWPLEDES